MEKDQRAAENICIVVPATKSIWICHEQRAVLIIMRVSVILTAGRRTQFLQKGNFPLSVDHDTEKPFGLLACLDFWQKRFVNYLTLDVRWPNMKQGIETMRLSTWMKLVERATVAVT